MLSQAWALLSLGLPVVRAQANQCFYAANKEAGSVIVPCSNAPGIQSCCQQGDVCLADNACWNPTYNVTYLYGCTDPAYQNYHCPFKCGPTFANAPYVGLDYCYNTTLNQWSCTHPPPNSDSIRPFNYSAQCYADSIIAFAGPKQLAPYLSLPSSTGGSTGYYSPTTGSWTLVPGYTPTASFSVSSASVPTVVEYISTIQPSSSSAPNANAPPTASSSSTGLKVGLGVGIAGGVLFISAIVLFCLMLRRRRLRSAYHSPYAPDPDYDTHETKGYGHKSREPRRSELPAHDSGSGMGQWSGHSPGLSASSHTYAYSEIGGASPPRTELPIQTQAQPWTVHELG